MRGMGSRIAVGVPIVVDGRLWGRHGRDVAGGRVATADTEPRLENFTELVATAIPNIEARSELAASRARIVAATDDERRRVVATCTTGQQSLVHTVITLKQAHQALDGREWRPELR